MKRISTITLCLLIYLFLTNTSSLKAQTLWYADAQAGSDDQDGLTQATAFRTFHRAYLAAQSGDEILLHGTFDWSHADEIGDQVLSGYTIAKHLTIRGSSPFTAILQSAPSPKMADRRVLTIADHITLKLHHLTIRHGYLTVDNAKGGGVFAGANTVIELVSCVVEENHLFPGNGTMIRGGGVYSNGVSEVNILKFESCVIRNNSSKSSGWSTKWTTYGDAGGVHVEKSSFVILNSTMYKNESNGFGGAIYGISCSFKMHNSLFAYNLSNSNIVSFTDIGPFNQYITNCTFSRNNLHSKLTSDHVVYFSLAISFLPAFICIKNTIIANNFNGNNVRRGWRRFGEMIELSDNGHNYIDAQSGNDFIDGLNNNIVGVKPNLHLASQLTYPAPGSIVPVLPLLEGSLLINAGSGGVNGNEDESVPVPLTDARGRTRIGAPDIGAYEFATNQWTGAVSNDWHTADNWLQGEVPSSDALHPEVIIPNGAQLHLNAPAEIASLTLNTGSILHISPHANLTLRESIILHGGTGSTHFSSAAQLTGTGSIAFQSPAQNAPTKNASPTVQNNNWPVETINLAQLSVRLKFEPNRWYFTGFPFNVAIIRNTQTGLQVTNEQMYIAGYDGHRRATLNSSQGNWKQHLSGPLLAGQGYIIAVNDTATYDFIAAEASGALNPSSKQTVYQHGVGLPSADNHRFWNFVVSPFLRTIPLENASPSQAPFYHYDGNTYQVALGGESYDLPPYSAFFLQAHGGDELDFAAMGQANLPAVFAPPTTLTINLTDGVTEDRWRLRQSAGFSADFRPGEDAFKFLSPRPDVPQLFSRHSSNDYAVLSLPATHDPTIQLRALLPHQKIHKLSLAHNHGYAAVYLKDKHKGTIINLAEDDYVFNNTTNQGELTPVREFELNWVLASDPMISTRIIDAVDDPKYDTSSMRIALTLPHLDAIWTAIRKGASRMVNAEQWNEDAPSVDFQLYDTTGRLLIDGWRYGINLQRGMYIARINFSQDIMQASRISDSWSKQQLILMITIN